MQTGFIQYEIQENTHRQSWAHHKIDAGHLEKLFGQVVCRNCNVQPEISDTFTSQFQSIETRPRRTAPFLNLSCHCTPSIGTPNPHDANKGIHVHCANRKQVVQSQEITRLVDSNILLSHLASTATLPAVDNIQSIRSSHSLWMRNNR